MAGRSLACFSRFHKAILLCLFLLPVSASLRAAAMNASNDWDYEETHSDSRDFAAGGMLHVHLNVGDLHIRRGDSAKINLHYTVKCRNERTATDARVDFETHGRDATLEFQVPTGHAQFDVELEVPQNTNLDVHEKVGDVTVEDVEGDKEVNLGVGDIHLSDGPSGYHLIHASAGIGDVNSAGYGETSGWLGKTLKYRGEGKYELRARVGVGDITLNRK
jgi:hypothetical protein